MIEKVCSGNNQILDILFRNNGSIFGGYIRDKISDISPKDMDVVLYSDKYESFINDMKNIGYTCHKCKSVDIFHCKISCPAENDAIILTRDENDIIVECIVCEDTSTSGILAGPCCDPDFDVNILIFDGDRIFTWLDPEIDCEKIYEGIKNKVAVEINPSEYRREKILSKGYTTIKNTGVYFY